MKNIKLLLATSNLSKFQDLLKYINLMMELNRFKSLHKKIEIFSLEDIKILNGSKPDENKNSYLENAKLKALYYHNLFYRKEKAANSTILTISEDAGLEIDVLNNKPGIFTNRFFKYMPSTYSSKQEYLIQKLSPYPRPWIAKYKIAIVLLMNNNQIISSEKETCGEIIISKNGKNGFGMDSIFYLNSEEKTMAELNIHQRLSNSHRGKALQDIFMQLDLIFERN